MTRQGGMQLIAFSFLRQPSFLTNGYISLGSFRSMEQCPWFFQVIQPKEKDEARLRSSLGLLHSKKWF
jgi:hypothetical protein